MNGMPPVGSDARTRAELAEQGPVPVRPWTILRYDTERFPFAKLLERDVFHVPRLDALHQHVLARRRALGLGNQLSHRDNLAVRKLMQDLPGDAPFYRLYHAFMLHLLCPLVGRGISYSSHPKMRIHFPGTGSVSSFHHDIIVTKRIDQVNFWMPFTNVADTTALWLESDYGRADYAPVPVQYGEALVFDGGYLGHGSVANDGDTTRVSLDLRFSYRKATTRVEGVQLMNRVVERIDAGAVRFAPPSAMHGPATN